MPHRARIAGAVSVACCIWLAGCGGSPGDAVHSKVQQFINAVSARDYTTICQQVLAPRLLADLAQGGVGCEQALKVALARVRQPSLVIGKVTVSGDTALALTLSSASGQSAVLTSIQLVRTSDGWRVSGLHSPARRSP
jgi:hypothetical protein